MGRRFRALSLAAAVLSAADRAPAADPLEGCVASYDAAQRLQHAGKLLEAETEAIACAQDACPAELRKDCLRWDDDVRRSTPSLVVHAVGADACDLETARVTIDGRRVAERLDGKALPLDPGAHAVRIEASGLSPMEQRVIVSEGEKNRVLEVRFAPAGATCGSDKAALPVEPRPSPAPAQDRARPVPPLVYVLSGVSALSLGVAGGFYVSALSQKGTLDDCRPRCASGDVDRMRRTYLIGDLLLATGVVSLAAAAVFFFTRGEAVPERAAQAR
jgi:hypothetical protein